MPVREWLKLPDQITNTKKIWSHAKLKKNYRIIMPKNYYSSVD